MATAFALAAALEPEATPNSICNAAKEGAVVGREYGDWSWCPPTDRRIAYVIEWVQTLPEKSLLTRLYELIGVDMYTDQLLPCALGTMCFYEGDPQRAMLACANLGGDADTLASMTGALCGGWRGLRAVNREWLSQVESTNQLDVRSTAQELIELRRKFQESG